MDAPSSREVLVNVLPLRKVLISYISGQDCKNPNPSYRRMQPVNIARGFR